MKPTPRRLLVLRTIAASEEGMLTAAMIAKTTGLDIDAVKATCISLFMGGAVSSYSGPSHRGEWFAVGWEGEKMLGEESGGQQTLF